MKALVMIAVLMMSTSSFAEEKADRSPAKVMNVDAALANALAEQQQTWRDDDDRAISRATSEEAPKIFIELGDES